MTERTTSPLRRCYLTTAGILVGGMAISVLIYLTAGEEQVNPLAEYEGSKKFAYELERIGGKGALVANELNTWFAGLWHGRQLAFTVACITLLIAAGYYVIASGNVPQQEDGKKGSDDD